MADSSRAVRTQTRQKARAKIAREQRLKAQVDAWFGKPLRDAVNSQAETVSDVSRHLQVIKTDLAIEVRSVKERVAYLEKHVSKIIAEEIEVVLAPMRINNQQICSNHERKLASLCEDMRHFKDTMAQERDKQKLEFGAFEVSTATRLEDAEHTTRSFQDSKRMLEKLSDDFESYVLNETQREVYTRRLEFVVKDMEARVWPWRPNMDRTDSPPPREDRSPPPREDRSPPPREDRIAAWQVASGLDGQTEASWPAGSQQRGWEESTEGFIMASPGPSPPVSARPTPPTSRPSSARFRGRDPGHMQAGTARAKSAAGSGRAAARPRSATRPTAQQPGRPRSGRPSSATSSRP